MAWKYLINRFSTDLSRISKGNEIKAISKKEKYNPCRIRITIHFRLKAGINQTPCTGLSSMALEFTNSPGMEMYNRLQRQLSICSITF